jgi:hypothetical protein
VQAREATAFLSISSPYRGSALKSGITSTCAEQIDIGSTDQQGIAWASRRSSSPAFRGHRTAFRLRIASAGPVRENLRRSCRRAMTATHFAARRVSLFWKPASQKRLPATGLENHWQECEHDAPFANSAG